MKILKHLTSHWFIGFAVLAMFYAHFSSNEPFIEALRNRTFDIYQRLAPRESKPEEMMAQVAIIDIDDASLAEIGQWPWPRTIVAQLVENLMSLGALVIGFDIVFAEPDRLSPPLLADEIPDLPQDVASRLKEMPTNEQILAETIAKSRVVLGQVGIDKATDLSHLKKKIGFHARSFGEVFGEQDHPKFYTNHYPGIVQNRPELEEAATGIGLFSTHPDEDGVYRKVSLLEQVGDITYPSLSLEMLRVALQGKDDYFVMMSKPAGLGISEILVRTFDPEQNFPIPTDPHGRVWVHFAKYGTDNSIYVPAKDILNLNADTRAELEKRVGGRLAVVGTSAVGLKDIRPTPISGALPGVEVHAQLLETILSKAYLTRPDFAIAIEKWMIIIGGLMMIFWVPRLSAVYTFLLAAAQIGVLVWLAQHYYLTERVLIDITYPSLSIFTMFMLLSYLNYMREEKERAQIKNAFGHYVSPALLDQLADNPERLALGGETRNITILFSDIRGFTTISEMFDAHGLTQFINKFLTPMTNVIMEHKGTIDKYMGDAIMAFWNAPLEVQEHPKWACEAALKMQEAVKGLNQKMKEDAEREGRKHVSISVGVGLNTGPCCVGNMGSDQRFDYSALGDDVNLASRLEGQSKTYGVDVVVGHNTKEQLGGEMALLELDLIQVKGKTEPVLIYALLGGNEVRDSAAFKELTELNTQLIAAYRSQKWEDALALAAQCRVKAPHLETLWELYEERIAEYKENPPGAEWDGSYVATSK